MQSAIRLFGADPDLANALPEGERERAERVAVVPAVRVPPGPWIPADAGAPRWGMLVVDGLIAREVSVAGTGAAELLGAGDVIAPETEVDGETLVSDVRWTVLEPLYVALLDERFGAVIRQWPAIAGCLVERCERRNARLAVAQAISHLTRVDTRVLVMLWTLAGRWGRVGPDGIALPLRLTHRTLAHLVGARRPSVTTAISDLTRRELVARRDDGSWLLLGPPPEELERVGLERISAEPAPPPRVRALPAEPAAARAGHEREGDPRDRLPAIVLQVRKLAEAYETHAEQTREMSTRSREVRERSRRLRREIAAQRERSS